MSVKRLKLAIFDVPLHDAFHQASNRGAAFDLRIIFRDTLVQKRPGDAVTFVENHDTVCPSSLVCLSGGLTFGE
jgi:alpha-amylase